MLHSTLLEALRTDPKQPRHKHLFDMHHRPGPRQTPRNTVSLKLTLCTGCGASSIALEPMRTPLKSMACRMASPSW